MYKIIVFLILQIFFIIFLAFVNRKYWNWKLKNYQIAIILAFIFYVSLLLITVINIYNLSYKTDAFDINFDGKFSLEEKTTEQQEALRGLQKAYEGKNRIIILGPIVTLAYFLIIIIPLKFLNKRRKLST